MNSKRWLVLLVQNWRLVVFVIGLSQLYRGLQMWSPALATVALGTVLVALAIVPSVLLRRKDRS